MPVPMLVYLAAIAGSLSAADVNASATITTGDDELALVVPIGKGNRKVKVTVETSDENDDFPSAEIPLDVDNQETYAEETRPAPEVEIPEMPVIEERLEK